jgi:radical SAM protein with 4Fe4S-binding SPASM domain
MERELFQKLETDLFSTLKLCRIGGNNLGEQLCCEMWDEHFETFAKYSFIPWLITNGHLLTAKRIRKLVESECHIDISIDAATESKYWRIRGASLEKLIRNVHEIARERERQGKKKCRINFHFTAFQENINDLSDLLRIGAEIGIDQVTAIHFLPTTEEQRHQSLFYHQTTANEVFLEAKQLSEKLSIKLLIPQLYPIAKLSREENLSFKQINRSFLSGSKSKVMPVTKCIHPWKSVSINERGEVFPCCQSNLMMGTLQHSAFGDIWNNKRYQRLRKTVNSADPLKDCTECPLRGNTLTGTDCENNEYFLKSLNYQRSTKIGKQAYFYIKEFLNRNKFTKKIYPTLRYLYKRIP